MTLEDIVNIQGRGLGSSGPATTGEPGKRVGNKENVVGDSEDGGGTRGAARTQKVMFLSTWTRGNKVCMYMYVVGVCLCVNIALYSMSFVYSLTPPLPSLTHTPSLLSGPPPQHPSLLHRASDPPAPPPPPDPLQEDTHHTSAHHRESWQSCLRPEHQ